MALLSSLFSDYGERPLKLVLKVSGNEVTTGSSSRDTFYDEQSAELDKPKEKKKKKKKDKERNLGSPSDDRGKKKVMPVFFPSSQTRKCREGFTTLLFVFR